MLDVLHIFNEDVFSLSLFCILSIIMLLISFVDLAVPQKNFRPIIFTLGIMGTFVGIAYGLYKFEPTDIDSSIPELLSGLKTAFFTSIVGMLLATILEIISKIKNTTEELSSRNSNYYLDEIYQFLKENINTKDQTINETLLRLEDIFKSSLDINIQNIKEFHKTLTNNNKSNNEKFELLMSSLKGNFTTLNNSFEKLINAISQGASEAIIKALEKSMKEFNENLKKNFGENFKQLNDACLKMIIWQEQYKNQVEENVKQIKTIASMLEKINDTYNIISEKTEQATDVYEKIGELIEKSRNHTETMVDLFGKYGNFINEGKEIFKEVGHEFGQLKENLSGFTDGIRKNIESQSFALAQLTEDMGKEFPKALKELNETLTALTRGFIKSYGEFIGEKGISRIDKLPVNQD